MTFAKLPFLYLVLVVLSFCGGLRSKAANLWCIIPSSLQLMSAIFYEIFIFHQTIPLQKLRKMFFISPKKLFSFLRYSNFCISVFLSTYFVGYLGKEKSCDIETLSIDRVLDKEYFYEKIMQKMYTKSYSQIPF